MIVVAGLSPAWQQIMRFDVLRLGEVNRASKVDWCASGKVVNVALALARLGVPVEMVCMYGGSSGDQVCCDVENAGVIGHWVRTASSTRVCTTLLEAGSAKVTELVENTAAASQRELDAFRVTYHRVVERAELVVLAGSLPAGAPPNFYRELLSETPCPAILDFRGPELWAALEFQPLLVKPNREELALTVGRELSNQSDVRDAVAELHQRGAQWVAITDGGRPMLVSGPTGQFSLVPPTVEVVNPIGSGDCLAAGVAWGIVEKREMPECLRRGVAAAAENVGQLLPARLDPRAVLGRVTTVRVQGV